MKKILYLSFYFEPDLCAGSFRNSSLARELSMQLNGKAQIDVITTLPNRYNSFFANSSLNQLEGNLIVRRILLPRHKSGFIDQVLSFSRYYFSVLKMVKKEKYDLVFASSSRLFTAFLGYRIAKRKKITLYLDIRDIFTDTINDVISSKIAKIFLLPVLQQIEKRVFTFAKHINLISAGFSSYFSIYKGINYSYFTNGIDDEFIFNRPFEECLSNKPITITYAGNIGEGQGLHKIIPQIAEKLGEKYLFRIIGDGGAKKLLEMEISSRGLTNVLIENPIKRSEIIEVYKRSHFLFMHLNDYKAFEKVLPSKLFELGAFPRPILAGVSGFARSFIKENLPDVILFTPTKYNELYDLLAGFQYIFPDRKEFIDSFQRKSINREMAKSIAGYI